MTKLLASAVRACCCSPLLIGSGEAKMASKAMMTGMQGVFLVAAELSRRGFIVSTTSRNALGADLLVTDQKCLRAWSVQVKTNSWRASYWLTGAKALTTKSPSHIYVFVNLGGDKPQFVVVPSERVAADTQVDQSKKGSVWYSFSHKFDPDGSANSVGWEVFGNAEGDPPVGADGATEAGA
jgi:hypothetical protein